jgi:dihydrofolate synthase/folylpolyglutamate synthase
MTYQEAVDYLCSLQLFGANLGLANTSTLAELAGQPQQQLRFIHVAGTNGKGSTCAMLESIYRATGLRVGLYTSPHLVSFRERIQIDRKLISETDVARLVAEARGWLAGFSRENHPTFFEVVTVIAARYFAEQKCDLVIWETGLGGRLDATNIVTPQASVITNVQFDHESWLGYSLEAIAREKAGIIKPGVPVITAAEGGALVEIRETARRLNAPLHLVSEPVIHEELGLRGEHQRLNAAVALMTVEALEDALPVPRVVVRDALVAVQWPARFQILRRGAQTIILDGAHNPAGAKALTAALRAEFGDAQFTFITGMLEDKNWSAAVSAFAEVAQRMIFVPVASNRTAKPAALVEAAQAVKPELEIAAAGSLTEALAQTGEDSHVVITGSLYLIGEAMELLGLGTAANERALNEWTGPK